MPIELNETREDRTHFDVTYAGATARVWFYPDDMTMDWLTEFLDHAEDDLMHLCEMSAGVIQDWDIFDNGQKVTIDREGFGTIPSPLAMKVIEGMQQEAMKRAKIQQAPVAERRRRGTIMDAIFGPTEEKKEADEPGE